MSRAYPVTLSHADHHIRTKVSVFDLSRASSENLADTQLTDGASLWSKGRSTTDLFPRNAYLNHTAPLTAWTGTWFFTGDSNMSQITLLGIEVAGGCVAQQMRSALGASAFLDRCRSELGQGWDSDTLSELNAARSSLKR